MNVNNWGTGLCGTWVLWRWSHTYFPKDPKYWEWCGGIGKELGENRDGFRDPFTSELYLKWAPWETRPYPDLASWFLLSSSSWGPNTARHFFFQSECNNEKRQQLMMIGSVACRENRTKCAMNILVVTLPLSIVCGGLGSSLLQNRRFFIRRVVQNCLGILSKYSYQCLILWFWFCWLV